MTPEEADLVLKVIFLVLGVIALLYGIVWYFHDDDIIDFNPWRWIVSKSYRGTCRWVKQQKELGRTNYADDCVGDDDDEVPHTVERANGDEHE